MNRVSTLHRPARDGLLLALMSELVLLPATDPAPRQAIVAARELLPPRRSSHLTLGSGDMSVTNLDVLLPVAASVTPRTPGPHLGSYEDPTAAAMRALRDVLRAHSDPGALAPERFAELYDDTIAEGTRWMPLLAALGGSREPMTVGDARVITTLTAALIDEVRLSADFAHPEYP